MIGWRASSLPTTATGSTSRSPGDEPAIVLMHGFPDDRHLYDRVQPLLDGRRVVAFDFLGRGRSDKPTGYPYVQVDEPQRVADLISSTGA